jgi:hypothetical protein
VKVNIPVPGMGTFLSLLKEVRYVSKDCFWKDGEMDFTAHGLCLKQEQYERRATGQEQVITSDDEI